MCDDIFVLKCNSKSVSQFSKHTFQQIDITNVGKITISNQTFVRIQAAKLYVVFIV